MRMQAFHLSSQGASHIKKNKECQDASESFYNENCAIAIVCDGHGGDDYVRSASGSAFACAVAKANILNFIENIDKDELVRHHQKLIHNLEASIISAWNEAVYAHYESHPFTESEIAVLSDRAKRKYLQEKRIESAYGTTLIAVACTENYCVEFCREHYVDVFLPRRGMLDISKHIQRFTSIGTKVMVDDYSLISVLNHKNEAYELFKKEGIGIVPEYRMVTTTEQFCRGYSELKEQYKQVCFKFVKDEGGKSFRLIDNSKTGYATLFKKQTTRMT